MPTTANKELKTSVAVTDWQSIFFAPAKSPAPIRCATWTENPVAAAAHNPQNSHVVVETNPMEAAAFAPSYQHRSIDILHGDGGHLCHNSRDTEVCSQA